MNYRRFGIAILSLAVLLLVSITASTSSLRRGQSRVSSWVTHGNAFAALQPVGEAEGWGRAIVRDDELPNDLHRTVQVWLFGMSSRTEYQIEIDGVEVGAILTRSSGSGVLKLQNAGKGHDPVPEDLPPAADIETITVWGPSGDPVLEGTFTHYLHPGGDTTYEEEIALDDVTHIGAAGMAEVEMKEGGHQEFKSHATGLAPFSPYTVVVDDQEVGVVTTDAQGQARIHLEDPDDDNPLPTGLLPVSDIIKVEWKDSTLVTVLFGQFTGVGVCEHLVGTVSIVTATGFTLETDDGPVSVVTNDDTEWEDFGDHEFVEGDKVKVEGCWDGDEMVAEKVEYKGGNDAETCAKYVGAITSVSGEGFLLKTDTETIPVVTTAETEWEDFGDHEPAVDDIVKVEGCWDGDFFVAEVVELKSHDAEEKCANYMGIVTAGSEDEFTLETNKETISVITTADTEWDGFGGHAFAVGDKVKVKGCWDGDFFYAEEVELKKGAKRRRIT